MIEEIIIFFGDLLGILFLNRKSKEKKE